MNEKKKFGLDISRTKILFELMIVEHLQIKGIPKQKDKEIYEALQLFLWFWASKCGYWESDEMTRINVMLMILLAKGHV